MEKYLVIDERKDGNGDIFIETHDNLESANDDAQNQWDSLMVLEKEQRHIFVVQGEEDEDSGNWLTSDEMFDSVRIGEGLIKAK